MTLDGYEGLCEATQKDVDELIEASGFHFQVCPLCGQPPAAHPDDDEDGDD